MSEGSADGLRRPQGRLTAAQKSAEGVVGPVAEGPNGPEKGLKERASSSDVS